MDKVVFRADGLMEPVVFLVPAVPTAPAAIQLQKLIVQPVVFKAALVNLPVYHVMWVVLAQ
jgi:hypothetical protein